MRGRVGAGIEHNPEREQARADNGQGMVVEKSAAVARLRFNHETNVPMGFALASLRGFALTECGHNSKAVHRAYARNAKVELPALGEYKRQRAKFRQNGKEALPAVVAEG